MPAQPPKAPSQRRRRNVPARGEWKTTPGIGWQHGPVPEPPAGLTEESVATWRTWMGSWFAAHWQPGDVPGLCVVIQLYDQIVRGRYTRATELRLWAADYGITPKGQADRRWQRPELAQPAKKVAGTSYLHLMEDSPA